jgi:enamine deaminase RidA (YjgF/YER057c/UK114 family)
VPHERITAEELLAPPGYAHAVRVGSLVHTAGAVPMGADGSLVGKDDLEAQTRQTLANLEAQLAAAGATADDVAKAVVYVAAERREDLHVVWEVFRASAFGGVASTLLGVSFLGYTGQLVEIEAVAVVPEEPAPRA